MSDRTEIYAPPLVPDHELLRVIGRGSYGEVWHARNVMGTPRAVKVIKRQDFDYARPFDREFEGIQRYEPVSRSHEGLVHALHVGHGKERDYFYYVMELADDAQSTGGQSFTPGGFSPDYRPRTLRDEITRLGALPVSECIEIGLILAGALGHLHKHGLVHRDVKPSNIIYVNGRPKLADVGLVARMSDTRSIVGTEGFVAPEGTGQPKSDVFSLGRVLYECLTGNDRMNFPDVPDSWCGDEEGKARFEVLEIVLRAGDADASRRYTDTSEMIADLALLQAGKSVRHIRRMETRLRRTMQILAVAALCVAVAGGAWMLERGRRQAIETAEQRTRAAKAETQRLLGDSLAAQARSLRKIGQAGARTEALAAVRQARDAGASIEDVRTQAASALGLLDIGDFSAAWPPNHSFRVRTSVSEDGKFAVTGFDNDQCRIYRRTSEGCQLLCTIEEKGIGPVDDLSITPGGKWVTVQLHDGRFLVYNAHTGARAWELSAELKTRRPAFSMDGTWGILSDTSGLEAVEMASGRRVTLAADGPKAHDIRLSPDGTWIASLADGEKGFRVYTGLPGRMPDNASRIKMSTIESDMDLNGPSISGDSRYLAAAVGEDRLRVWAMPGRQQIAWLRGHQRTVRATAFHPFDSSVIASTAYDGTTRLWDIPTRQQILVAPTGGDFITFEPESGEMILRSWSGDYIRTASLNPLRAMRVLMLPPDVPFGLFAGVTFSQDGRLVAAAGDAGIIVWVLATGQIVQARPPLPHAWRSVLFSKDGKWLYTAGGPGLFRHPVQFNDAGEVRIDGPEQIKEGRFREMLWAGNRLAATNGLMPAEGGRENKITFFSPDGSEESLVVPHYADNLALSSDGRWVACTTYPQGVGSLFDLQSADRKPRRVEAVSRCTFAFPPHHPVLAIGSDRDVSFRPLEAAPAPPPPPLERTLSEFIPGRMAFSPDGTLMALSSSSAEVSLYDARTLKKIATLDSPLTPFDCVLAFSADSHHLAVAGGVSRVVIWDLDWLKDELAKDGLGW